MCSSAATQPSSATAIAAEAVSRSFVGGSTAAFRNAIRGGVGGILLGQGVGRTFVLGNSIGIDQGTPVQMETGVDMGTAALTFVQNNTIANISGVGVAVGAPTNRIRRNSMYGNLKGAIVGSPGAGIPAPPVITAVTLSSVAYIIRRAA